MDESSRLRAWRLLGASDVGVSPQTAHRPASRGGVAISGGARSLARASYAWTVSDMDLETGLDVKRWAAGNANAADVVVPQASFTRPLTRMLLTEIGAEYVIGHFHEAPSTTDIPVRGWMLRTGLRVEP